MKDKDHRTPREIAQEIEDQEREEERAQRKRNKRLGELPNPAHGPASNRKGDKRRED